MEKTAKLDLTSETFEDGGRVPMSILLNGMGCAGENVSPQLAWSGAPLKTKSFAVICHDPDAPTGVGFFHWVMFNIPADVTELKKGAGARNSPDRPAGSVLGYTDYGVSEYGGPCPAVGHGDHHYEFTVYALSGTIDADQTTTGAKLRFMVRTQLLAAGTITGLASR